jgi:Ca2+-binding EF-hand superfamily protein
MKLTKTLFVASALALAVGGAYAKDDKIGAGDRGDPGFKALDKDGDGMLSRTEAAGNPDLVRQFKTADKNGDGKLSRVEYLTVMTKKDFNTAKDKVSDKMDRNGDKPKSERAANRGDKIGAGDKGDPGFAKLDKDKDGSLTKTEAGGNPDLVSKWDQADKNNDGKLSRAEYLAVMTKKDARTAKEGVKRKTDDVANRDRDRSASTGGSTARGTNDPNAPTTQSTNPNPNQRSDQPAARGSSGSN